MKAFFDLPFIQVALPIVISLFLGVFMQNKRLDEMSKRFEERFGDMSKRFEDRFDEVFRRLDKIDQRLEKIEVALHDHDTRLVRLETRTWK